MASSKEPQLIQCFMTEIKMSYKNNHKDNEIKVKEILLKRTLPGRLAAKKKGKLGGRPRKLNAERIALLQKLYNNPKNTVENICNVLEISKPSFYTYLHERHGSDLK